MTTSSIQLIYSDGEAVPGLVSLEQPLLKVSETLQIEHDGNGGENDIVTVRHKGVGSKVFMGESKRFSLPEGEEPSLIEVSHPSHSERI